MANKYDLKIATLVTAGGGAVDDIGGQVPKGKTRFVCFVKLSMVAADLITLGEGAVAGVGGPIVTNKDITELTAAGVLAYPDKVDVNNPMFSIAEEQYLKVSNVAAATHPVTVVYFDE